MSDNVNQSRARVAEFVRQWLMATDKTDIIYGIHFDANTDGAELLASDLDLLLKAGE